MDLVPHDLALPLFVLNPLVDKAAAAGNPLKHLSQVIIEVHMLFSSLVEGELILEMLSDIFLINYLNELELPIGFGQHLNEGVLILHLAHDHLLVVIEAKLLIILLSLELVLGD